jgi:hypothetical protein
MENLFSEPAAACRRPRAVEPEIGQQTVCPNTEIYRQLISESASVVTDNPTGVRLGESLRQAGRVTNP